jgi:Mn2+/Fe2+ NRAMP family transporter
MKERGNTLSGAAFLMAASATGPGFLTQSAYFTERYGPDFSAMIILSVLLSLVAQLNIWSVIVVSNKRGQDIADEVLHGFGHFIALLIFLGGIAFNIGNIAGTGMGLNVLFGIDVRAGAMISALLCILVFAVKEFGKTMDILAKLLGCLMICLCLIVAILARPPLKEVMIRTFMPERFEFMPLTTLVGGTVGGYVTFSGAHRLLDGGIKDMDGLKDARKTSIVGIAITMVVRYLVFFVCLGTVAKGIALDPENPAATPFFEFGGYALFGVVLWVASITPVVGCSYTSVSFIRSYFRSVDRRFPVFVMLFISLCAALFVLFGRPVELLVLAGAINGLILPFTLLAALLACRNRRIVGEYNHPAWLFALGLIVLAFSVYAGIRSFGGIMDVWR